MLHRQPDGGHAAESATSAGVDGEAVSSNTTQRSFVDVLTEMNSRQGGRGTSREAREQLRTTAQLSIGRLPVPETQPAIAQR